MGDAGNFRGHVEGAQDVGPPKRLQLWDPDGRVLLDSVARWCGTGPCQEIRIPMTCVDGCCDVGAKVFRLAFEGVDEGVVYIEGSQTNEGSFG